jgi:membrane fusion protein, heavy metal efflux system
MTKTWIERARSLAVVVALLPVLSGCRDAERAPVKGTAFAPSGGEKGGENSAEGRAEVGREDVVRLDARDLEEHGVSIATAGPGVIDPAIELSGVIRPNGDRLAHIVPRFPGVVREVRRTIGDAVKAGDVLAVVESSGSLARYELQTMISGLVIERHITLGEAVQSDTQAFVVADLQNVWVDLSAFQKDLSRIRVGQPAKISAEHFMDAQAATDCKVTYVTPVIDEATRTATVRAVLPNPRGAWRPGMFVTAKLSDPAEVAVAVPDAALQSVEGRTVVFVETPNGLIARPVTLGRRGETLAEVRSGLEPGERYAAEGSFLLKAELGKGAAEHAH